MKTQMGLFEQSQFLHPKFNDFIKEKKIRPTYSDNFQILKDCWEAGFNLGTAKRSIQDYRKGYDDACSRAINLIEEDRQS